MQKEIEMKKLINVLAVALFVVFASYNVLKAQRAEVMSDIAKENVEALANDENSGSGSCSVATSRGNCYDDSTGMWCCLRIKSVRTSDVEPGSILECHHDKVNECTSGTSER